MASSRSLRPVRTWDIVTTIVLLAVMVAVAGLAFFLSFFLAFASDPCGSVTCDYDRMGGGFLLALIGPVVVAILALVAGIVVLVQRFIAFWIPIAGLVLIVVVFLAGAWLVVSGVPGATF